MSRNSYECPTAVPVDLQNSGGGHSVTSTTAAHTSYRQLHIPDTTPDDVTMSDQGDLSDTEGLHHPNDVESVFGDFVDIQKCDDASQLRGAAPDDHDAFSQATGVMVWGRRAGHRGGEDVGHGGHKIPFRHRNSACTTNAEIWARGIQPLGEKWKPPGDGVLEDIEYEPLQGQATVFNRPSNNPLDAPPINDGVNEYVDTEDPVICATPPPKDLRGFDDGPVSPIELGAPWDAYRDFEYSPPPSPGPISERDAAFSHRSDNLSATSSTHPPTPSSSAQPESNAGYPPHPDHTTVPSQLAGPGYRHATTQAQSIHDPWELPRDANGYDGVSKAPPDDIEGNARPAYASTYGGKSSNKPLATSDDEELPKPLTRRQLRKAHAAYNKETQSYSLLPEAVEPLERQLGTDHKRPWSNLRPPTRRG